MNKAGYKIDQLAHSYPNLRARDMEFFIVTVQDKLRKILSQYEKDPEKRTHLMDTAKKDILQTLSEKNDKFTGSFADRIKQFVTTRIQKYKNLLSAFNKSVEASSPQPTDELLESGDIHFKERPYQKKGIQSVYTSVKNIIRRAPGKEAKKIENMTLVNAATGSGKSYIISQAMNKIYALRGHMERLGHGHIPLRILVLSDRIGTLRQARGSYIDGYKRGEKEIPPAFDESLRKSLKAYEYHSAAENASQTETRQGVMTDTEDSITFATFQTAGDKDIGDGFNIILIPEAHHLPAETFYEAFLKYYQPFEINGVEYHPIVIPDTATADGELLDITGSPAFSYPLHEFLASERAPDVTYHIIACQNIEQKDIIVLQQIVKDVSAIKDPVQKQKQLSELKRSLNNYLAKFPDDWSMVDDFLDRVGEDIGPTIIACDSIKQAELVRNIFAQKLPPNKKVMSYHSDSKDEGAFELFANGEVDVLVTVDMCMEAVDMPDLENYVLWKNMRSRKEYMQALGRGMRGDHITYWDYVGGYTNFTRINDLYRKTEEAKKFPENRGNHKTFSLVHEGILSVEPESYEIDILDIMTSIEEIERGLHYKKADAQNIYDMYDQGLLHVSHITPQNWTKFAKGWNKEHGMNEYTIPTSFAGLIGLLGGDKEYSSSLRYARALVQREPFTLKPWATKKNLQKLWTDNILTKELLSSRSYNEWAEKQNEEGIFPFELPSSVHGLHTILYRYQRNPNTGVNYLAALLDEKEFIAEKVATKEQIIGWAQQKEKETDDDYMIPTSAITTAGYAAFAKHWNDTKGNTLGKIPYTLGTLARLLDVDEVKIPYIRAVLQGNEIEKAKPYATPEQLREMRNNKQIPEEAFSNDKWHAFAKSWNEQVEAGEIESTFLLPRSMRLLFTTIGGTGESITRAHTVALFNQAEYTPPLPLATKQKLIEMFKSGLISEEVIQAEKRREFSGAWNELNSTGAGYTLPLDFKSLITQLGGDYRYDATKEYGKALLHQEYYIKRPLATKQKLEAMIANEMIPLSALSHKNRNIFANQWNEDYSVLWLCTLPLGFDKFGEILLQNTDIPFSPDAVKAYIFPVAEEVTDIDAPAPIPTVVASTSKKIISTRQKEAEELKEKIRFIKIKAKEFREKKDYAKAYALYYHTWTLDNKDLLCKTRMNEINAMGIKPTKQETIIALREISVVDNRGN